MRVVVFGAGGVGGTIAGRLHRAGAEVVAIARGAHADAMRREGLRLVTPDGDWRLRVPVAAHPKDLDWRQDDIVVLAVKSQQSARALADLAAVAPETTVVCAQNGVANERLALERFERVLGMVVWLPALHLEPGLVVAHGAGRSGVLDCGLYPQGSSDVARELASILDASGFSSRADVEVMRWKRAKLLTNLGNALEALCGRVRAGDIVRPLREEARACFAAAGLSCASPDEVRERLEGAYRMAEVPGFDRGGGSTWQSLQRGSADVETAYLNGEIVALGRAHGVLTPVNAALAEAMDVALKEGAAAGSWSVDRLREFVAKRSAGG